MTYENHTYEEEGLESAGLVAEAVHQSPRGSEVQNHPEICFQFFKLLKVS